jgi:hypothetical protein
MPAVRTVHRLRPRLGPAEVRSKKKIWQCTVVTFEFLANCDANPNFLPTASGGDGDDVQFWYVGFDPDLAVCCSKHYSLLS